MSAIPEGIRVENDKKISFGNYQVKEKIKVNDFEFEGNKYTLRSHDKMNRLQKNGALLFESVPGSSVYSLDINNEVFKFEIEGFDDTQITLELEPNTKYRIFIDNVTVDGNAVSNMSGKINFSLPLSNNKQVIKIEKI